MSANLGHRARWEAGLGGWIKQIFHSVPQIPADVSLKGQTAVITGSSTGLGLESAHQFLQKGLSTLVLGIRSQKKGDAAASKLRTTFPKANILVWLVDMESYQSVRDFAAKCETLDTLDIVILNAGGGRTVFERAEGGKGREITLQVNYLTTILLGILLIPVLAKKRASFCSRPGRLTLVGSDTAHQATLERTPTGILDSFDREHRYDGWQSYGRTKLLMLMFVAKLAEVVNPATVIVNVVNPSAVKGTELLRDAGGFSIMRVILWVIYAFFARNVSDGARQYMLAATVMGKGSHGSLVDFQVRP
jgi:NAD(P)-dependent dehydrogenase (short-subunit alcohol dehydrogenase family)